MDNIPLIISRSGIPVFSMNFVENEFIEFSDSEIQKINLVSGLLSALNSMAKSAGFGYKNISIINKFENKEFKGLKLIDLLVYILKNSDYYVINYSKNNEFKQEGKFAYTFFKSLIEKVENEKLFDLTLYDSNEKLKKFIVKNVFFEKEEFDIDYSNFKTPVENDFYLGFSQTLLNLVKQIFGKDDYHLILKDEKSEGYFYFSKYLNFLIETFKKYDIEIKNDIKSFVFEIIKELPQDKKNDFNLFKQKALPKLMNQTSQEFLPEIMQSIQELAKPPTQ